VHDSYLWLTPLLTLAVVALVGFVGCGTVFGLDHVEDPPPPLDPVTGVTLTPRDTAVDVDWDDYPGATAYTVHWGTVSGTHPASNTLTTADPRPHPVTSLPNGITHYFVVNATIGGKETPDSEEKSTVPGIYGVPINLISNTTLGTPRNFTSLMGVGVTIGPKRIQATRLGRAVVAGNSGTHRVRIIDKASNTEVAAADVSTAGTTPNTFAYADISPAVILNANTTYYILSDENMAGDQFFDANTTVTTTAAASRIYAAFGILGGPYNESPVNGMAYGPIDVVYVDLAPVP